MGLILFGSIAGRFNPTTMPTRNVSPQRNNAPDSDLDASCNIGIKRVIERLHARQVDDDLRTA